MPEAFTYFDMQRMIAAQVPSGVYYLEVHWRWHRKDNKTIRDQQLLPPLASTRTDGTSVYKAFDFKGSDVKFWGKALGTPIGNNRWFRVQFALHGHALPITRAEYEDMVKNWEALPTATTATLPGITTIAAAIVGEDIDRRRHMVRYLVGTMSYSMPNAISRKLDKIQGVEGKNNTDISGNDQPYKKQLLERDRY
ncbi:uncharacterized protein LAJ45_04881 [Morchella importuna]|uniref:uncharacterized protein n=1 Tax=Morchella importuna TaxID=1174673 RepID=UPI001E8DB184|nr:uncharacterized protein LAJ45_04881 [Morchella importuna]KAH8151179.1 hypothetical protein LAJ45_04881 [Morchella importuna]